MNDKSAKDIVKRLIYHDLQSKDDITILLNSPGGSINHGLAIYDAMQNTKSDVRTMCIGMAAAFYCRRKGKALCPGA